MPGYYETYLHGLQQAVPMARLAEIERQNAFRQQFQTRQLMGQEALRTQNLQRQTQADENRNTIAQQNQERMLKMLEARLAGAFNPPKMIETTAGPTWTRQPAPGAAPIGAGPEGSPASTPPTALMASTAKSLRDERAKNIAPLDEMQQQISKTKNLLATSTPAADRQVQELLTNVFDKTRATNMLFGANQNFGDIATRIGGYFGRFFTGQYTDEQRSQIRNMLDEMESGVIQPSRGKIKEHYSNLTKRYGLPEDLVGETPDFYSGSTGNPQAEADAFLRSRSARPR